MLDAGSWILNKPKSTIKHHQSSIQYQVSRIQHLIRIGNQIHSSEQATYSK
jgi:hypothetical protein